MICLLHIKNKISVSHVEIGDTIVPTFTVARNISVFFDHTLSMKNHMQHICSVAYFRSILPSRQNSESIGLETTEMMVHSYVVPRLHKLDLIYLTIFSPETRVGLDLLTRHQPTRTLHSGDDHLLEDPRSRLCIQEDRTFSHSFLAFSVSIYFANFLLVLYIHCQYYIYVLNVLIFITLSHMI